MIRDRQIHRSCQQGDQSHAITIAVQLMSAHNKHIQKLLVGPVTNITQM